MPAEWEPHEATWLGWPHEVTDWPGKFPAIPWAFAEIVAHPRARRTRVPAGAKSRRANRVRAILKKAGANLAAVEFLPRSHRSRLDARFRPDLRKKSASAKSASTISRSMVGQNIPITKKMPGCHQRQSETQSAGLAARTQRSPRRPGRRQHRRQRPRLAAHHRRMPAQQNAGAQSRDSPARTTQKFFANISASPKCCG